MPKPARKITHSTYHKSRANDPFTRVVPNDRKRYRNARKRGAPANAAERRRNGLA